MDYALIEDVLKSYNAGVWNQIDEVDYSIIETLSDYTQQIATIVYEREEHECLAFFHPYKTVAKWLECGDRYSKPSGSYIVPSVFCDSKKEHCTTTYIALEGGDNCDTLDYVVAISISQHKGNTMMTTRQATKEEIDFFFPLRPWVQN